MCDLKQLPARARRGRKKINFKRITCRTDYRKYCLFLRTIRDWNNSSLPPDQDPPPIHPHPPTHPRQPKTCFGSQALPICDSLLATNRPIAHVSPATLRTVSTLTEKKEKMHSSLRVSGVHRKARWLPTDKPFGFKHKFVKHSLHERPKT